jgi:hypothetical protein
VPWRHPTPFANPSIEIIAGHAFVQNLRRGYYELAVDASAGSRVAIAFSELARAI